jgi:hypothetical protein
VEWKAVQSVVGDGRVGRVVLPSGGRVLTNAFARSRVNPFA